MRGDDRRHQTVIALRVKVPSAARRAQLGRPRSPFCWRPCQMLVARRRRFGPPRQSCDAPRAIVFHERKKSTREHHVLGHHQVRKRDCGTGTARWPEVAAPVSRSAWVRTAIVAGVPWCPWSIGGAIRCFCSRRARRVSSPHGGPSQSIAREPGCPVSHRA